MKQITFICCTLAFTLLVWSCGSSNSEESTTTTETSTSSAAEKSVEDMANESAADALEEASKALRSLSENQEGEAVEVVDFKKLKALLPESIAGMARSESEAQKAGAMGMTIATAEARYEDGNRRLQVNFADAGGIPMAMMGLAAWTNAEIERETDDEYERTTNLKGHKAFERYNFKNKEGQISLVVAERFIVNIEGDNVEESDLQNALDALDLDQLAGLQ